MKKGVPNFKSQDEERDYWASHDSTEHVDWSAARRVLLPNLKPSLKIISVRLPQSMIDELKVLANRRDVPYQSLMKMFLAERIEQELRSVRPTSRS
jgi:predicted DNA binding CopG/RHH family protein